MGGKPAGLERCFEASVSLQKRRGADCADTRSAGQLIGWIAPQRYKIRNLRGIDAVAGANFGGTDTRQPLTAHGIEDRRVLRSKLKGIAVAACDQDCATAPFLCGGPGS